MVKTIRKDCFETTHCKFGISKILIPLVCHIMVILIFQVLLWSWVRKEPWYIKPIPGSDDAVKSSDNTVLFCFQTFSTF